MLLNNDNANDITDLEEARRVIMALRRELAELEASTQPIENEFAVFLDDEHAAKLTILWERQQLVEGQDEGGELDEVFDVFVDEAIDLRWDLVADDNGWPLKPTVTA